MKFSLNNIGIVESADIELKGLTVLTGLNDTGKSFLSKAIFSVIKTNREASSEYRNLKFQQIQAYFRNIQSIESTSYIGLSPEILNNLKSFNNNANVLFNYIVKSFNDNLNFVVEEEVKIELTRYRERIEDALNKNSHPQITVNLINYKKTLSDAFEKIISILDTKIEDPNKDYKNFYNEVIIPQLFRKQINSINDKESNLTINVDEIGLNISVKNNNCEYFHGTLNEVFNDAIYIESPTSLQLVTFISNALAFGGNLIIASQQRLAGLPYHIYDLVSKIVNNVNNLPIIDLEDYINDIRTTIGGKLFYDQVNRSVIYSKENGSIFDINIASGIKGFGIMDILISENILNKKTLLIIDEPEVHLHPGWEIKYAELLVKLSSIGIPILISSHSVYFIKALTKFIQQYSTESITRFYFGQKEQGKANSTFRDVTYELNPIFKALSEPMAKII